MVLSFSDRQLLYDRIDSRVDAMIDSGLIDEVKRIKNSTGFGETSSQAIGYKEILLYLDGQNTKEEAISAIKQNTRRYAKRQTTWFGRKKWETLFVDSIWNEKEIIVKKSLNYFSKYI